MSAPVKQFAKLFIQCCAQFIGIDTVHRLANHLCEIGLHAETHRCARPIVQVQRFFDEFLSSNFHEAGFDRRRGDGIPKLIGLDALGCIAVCKGMKEDGACNVAGHRWLASEVFGIETLSDSRIFAGHRCYVGGERGGICSLAKPGCHFVADRAITEINVVRMNRMCIAGLCFPQVPDSSGQKPQHAACALERGKTAGLFDQRVQCFRVQRVSAPELLAGFGAECLGRH